MTEKRKPKLKDVTGEPFQCTVRSLGLGDCFLYGDRIWQIVKRWDDTGDAVVRQLGLLNDTPLDSLTSVTAVEIDEIRYRRRNP
jgi:hypothetical protein